MQSRRNPARGARGRIVAVLSEDRARAEIDGRTVVVTSLKGGPFSCGDVVRVVGEAPEGAVVDHTGGRAPRPLVVVVVRDRRWRPATASS